MIEEGVCGSSASIKKVYDTLCHCCITPIQWLKRRKKMRIGGRHDSVFIDESKFHHQKKVQMILTSKIKISFLCHVLQVMNNNMTVSFCFDYLLYNHGRFGRTWRRKHSWVFGMLEVRATRQKAVLKLVKHCSRRHLLHIIRTGSQILSDYWRAYNTVQQQGYKHFVFYLKIRNYLRFISYIIQTFYMKVESCHLTCDVCTWL